MNEKAVLKATKTFVQDYLKEEASGHDWWHIVRVTNMAERLAKEEGANVFLCQMSALLHDIADEKVSGTVEKGVAVVRQWLDQQAFPIDQQELILEIIENMSFQAGKNDGYPLNLEGQIVQDADRLDALGAIGIARTMVYSGHTGRPIHDPRYAIKQDMTLEEYRSNKGTAIGHFYEKLLLLSSKMNTKTGKELAKSRQEFMEDYLRQFYQEWDGEK